MTTHLYYYTGTGNSLWVARELASALGDTTIISMRDRAKPPDGTTDVVDKVADVVDKVADVVDKVADVVGIVFPVHMWGPPPGVTAYVKERLPAGAGYYFAVTISAGQPAGALKKLRKQLRGKDIELESGFSVVMPNVYIPFGQVPPEPRREEMFALTKERIPVIAEAVTNRSKYGLETGSFMQRLVFGGMHAMVVRQVPGLDKAFRADDTCTGCGICAGVCPVDNIEIVEGRPVWHHRCELCFSCIHWCPEESIQYGKNTDGKARYHHPNVTLSDILGQ